MRCKRSKTYRRQQCADMVALLLRGIAQKDEMIALSKELLRITEELGGAQSGPKPTTAERRWTADRIYKLRTDRRRAVQQLRYWKRELEKAKRAAR